MSISLEDVFHLCSDKQTEMALKQIPSEILKGEPLTFVGFLGDLMKLGTHFQISNGFEIVRDIQITENDVIIITDGLEYYLKKNLSVFFEACILDRGNYIFYEPSIISEGFCKLATQYDPIIKID